LPSVPHLAVTAPAVHNHANTEEDAPVAITAPLAYAPTLPGAQPPYRHAAYGSTVKRAPLRPPIRLAHTLSEVTGPNFADGWGGANQVDLTRQHKGAPLGERMILAGSVRDQDGKPVANTLVELWQCNSSGRYTHARDQHDAPLDPNFTGAGQVLTDAEGAYRFLTIKPGAYPWRNTYNSWRPAHIHLSVFGPAFATRLITQMYFPGDPLLDLDPIFQSTADAEARARLISRYDPNLSEAEYALGYRFDIVLRGRAATPMEA
jgi:protocatechuate 3,4-dioxygenase beta subunit